MVSSTVQRWKHRIKCVPLNSRPKNQNLGPPHFFCENYRKFEDRMTPTKQQNKANPRLVKCRSKPVNWLEWCGGTSCCHWKLKPKINTQYILVVVYVYTYSTFWDLSICPETSKWPGDSPNSENV
jgi:hypothetical protein